MQPIFDITADLDTPVSAFLKLKPFRPRFLLESVEGGERVARYSFIGFGEALEVHLTPSQLRVRSMSGQVNVSATPTHQVELLNALRSILGQAPTPTPLVNGLPLLGGLVGATAYDIVRYFEPKLKPEQLKADAVLAQYLAPQSILVFDHVTRRMALLHSGSELERAKLRKEILKALRAAIPPAISGQSFSPAVQSLNEKSHRAGVLKVKESIARGDVYQLVLSSQFSGETNLSPFEVYRALRLINPSPYMIYCELADQVLVGSSPEALVKLNHGIAQLRPIAGTRRRDIDALIDKQFELDLLADMKENAEHVMLVDLARNDLGRVANSGSIEVNPYRIIERYSHVMHMVSGVSGTLRPGKDLFDLYAATFPAGTLVGAPKVRAMELIDELEPVGRGYYGGTYGYFGANGDMDQAITIRSLVFSEGRYTYQAGGGLVADSDPEAEYQEIMAKSAVLRSALTLASEGV
jgi:anthranilate synthase component 1